MSIRLAKLNEVSVKCFVPGNKRDVLTDIHKTDPDDCEG